jgi:parallel beta-helix repeat protein
VNISGNKEGVYMDAWSSNNTIMDCTVTNNLLLGIYISASWGNVVTNNKVSRNRYGVFLDEASNSNTIENNTLEENENGLYFYGESGNIQGNIVRANTVSNSSGGISLLFSKDNIIYHNNFVDNVDQVYTSDSADKWDRDGEGNYWSDYVGEDLDSDGVGDTQYMIDEYNQDNYPLMGLFSFFSVAWGEETYPFSVTCSHDILDFRFIQPEKMMSFDLINSDTASGFFKISLPTVLLGGPYTILLDDSPATNVNQTSNATHAFFYFTYPQGVRNIKIKGTTVIPEFSPLSLLLFFAVLVATILLQRTRLLKRQSVYA